MIPFPQTPSLRALLGAALAATFAISAPAQSIWFVNANAPNDGSGTSWSAPFLDLQDAISVARPGDQIWVAAGLYLPSVRTNPSDPRTATFLMPHDVAIYGGFAGYETSVARRVGLFDGTVLSGNIGSLSSLFDNAYHVVTLNGTTNYVTAVLDGFTVRDGYGLAGATSPSRGAGITVKLGGGTHTPTLIVENCTVTDNVADQGAGISVTNLGSVRLCKCSITNNRAESLGGGAYVQTAWLLSASTCWVNNVAVSRGGAVFTTSTAAGMVRLTDDTFYLNQANEGGGLYVVGSQFINGSATVSSCTFGCNVANAGVSIYANTAAPTPAQLTVRNSILWHEPQVGPATLVGSGSTVTVGYSCVLGGFPGAGNISSNPQLVDCLNGDLHLSASSPCIDAGNTTQLPNDYCDLDGDGDVGEALPVDKDGRRRAIDAPGVPNTGVGSPPVDMGAYER